MNIILSSNTSSFLHNYFTFYFHANFNVILYDKKYIIEEYIYIYINNLQLIVLYKNFFEHIYYMYIIVYI